MPKNKIVRLQPKAEQYIRDLDTAFHKLADQPGLGSDASYIHPNLMVYRVVSHLIFFKPSVYGINIIRVLHKSMDYGRHL